MCLLFFINFLFLTKWWLFKNYKKSFLFHLKSSFRSRNIQIFLFLSSPLFLSVSDCFIFIFIFFCQGFLHRHWQQGKGGDRLLHSNTSTRSQTLRHLFATLHVRWLSRIFNRNAYVYQMLADEFFHLIELSFEWLIDDAMFVYLMNWY